MKLHSLFIVFVFGSMLLHAQDFKPFRYDEDYRSLNGATPSSWYNNLKFTPLNKSGSAYLSSGGEIRYQYFRYTHEEWGDAPKDNDGFILSRYLFHSDLHFNNSVRLFAQLQSSLSDGRVTTPSPVEKNELDLHQLFVDFTLAKTTEGAIVLRTGRQELGYGSSRLVSPREGPNNRQSFDGGKLFYASQKVKADLFFTEYVVSKTGIFNDEIWNNGTKFGGAYVALNKIPFFQNIDLYYLGIRKSKSTWSDVTGRELRHSVGSRIAGRKNRWQYDFEGVYQFGNINDITISAWTLSSNTTYYLGSNLSSPFLGLKTEFISGDKRQGDNRIQSFNPLYPRGAYFGYAALIGPSNLFDVHPSVGIPIAGKFLASVDYDMFWRYSTSDGIYNPGARPMYTAGDSNKKFIGNQVGGTLEFTGNKFIYLRAEVTWFSPGSYIKSMTAGKDILYSGLTSTLKF